MLIRNQTHPDYLAFFQEFFQGESVIMQISIVMLIFLLFSDQISEGGVKVSEGGSASGRRPLWKKARFCKKLGSY